MTDQTTLKILRLEAENFKRIKTVEINPDGAVVVVGGRNSQGKTSVLDAIWAVLGGGVAAKVTKKPIRDGEDHARVMLDLGDLIVTRTWKGDTSALKVEAKDGSKYSSPQTVLDGFMGKLSFDPLAFTQLSQAEQVAALLELVDLPIDLSELAQKRLGLYDARTEIGRTVKSLRGQMDGLGEVEDAPNEEISQAALVSQYTQALEATRLVEDKRRSLEAAENTAERMAAEYTANEQRIADLKAEIANTVTIPDPEAIKAEIASAEDTNAKVRRNKSRVEAANKLLAEEINQHNLTHLIDLIDEQKIDALAEAVFPVAGLGFGDEGVTYGGIPFSQASSSEQIKVSLAMAMALNPRLRVIRILDGSLLDAENLALIAQMAKDQDYQIWIERVGDSDGFGIIIEDGMVSP